MKNDMVRIPIDTVRHLLIDIDEALDLVRFDQTIAVTERVLESLWKTFDEAVKNAEAES